MPVDPTQEYLVAEWDEPTRSSNILSNKQTATLILLSIPAAAILAAIGWFLKESTLYFAAVTAIVGTIAYAAQQRKPSLSAHIILTNTELVVGKQSYPLGDLAGFWLDHDGDQVVVNVEKVKSTMFPITFLSSSSSSEQTREQLSQVLAEVEPRRSSSINQLFRR